MIRPFEIALSIIKVKTLPINQVTTKNGEKYGSFNRATQKNHHFMIINGRFDKQRNAVIIMVVLF